MIGYAYDDRWQRGMTWRRFMLRRIIRLHPMVVLAVLFGAAAYLLQGSVKWDGTPVASPHLLLALLLGLLMIPSLPGTAAEVRGNGEMFPLNGPGWSLFFEYIGSLLYAVALHRLGVRWLKLAVVLSGIGLSCCALFNISGAYHLGVGWSMADYGFIGGFMRMAFSFSMGLLLSRTFRPRPIRGAFWLCSAIIALLFASPYLGGPEPSALNAVYDLVCILVIFPIVVYIGACGNTTDAFSSRSCEFLGHLSYPVYILHYPVMYLFYAWVWADAATRPFTAVWPVCVLLFCGIIVMAWLAMRFYDQPVRRYLSERIRSKKSR